MAITSSGIGSGLDIESLITQLMTVEAQPLNKLATKEASYQAKISAYGTVQSALSALQTAASGLTSSAKFAVPKASISDSSVVSASADADAPLGSHTIEVTALAKAQKVASNASTEPGVAPGDITFTFGTYSTDAFNVTSFAPSSASPVTVTLDAGSTLEELRDAINDADIGVTASVVDNGTVKQIVFTGDELGAANGFQISGSGGLSDFSFDASTGATSSLNSLDQAQDASLKLDGVTVTRTSNKNITDLIDGVTLNLNKVDVGNEVTINVYSDNSGASAAIQALVKAYNDTNTTLRSVMAYDAENDSAATLTGDATVRNIQSQLRQTFSSFYGTNGDMESLSDFGITFNKDGSLSVNTTKLDSVLRAGDANGALFFAGDDQTQGLADRLTSQLNSFLGDNGALEARTDGLKTSIASIEDQGARLNDRLVQIEARYRAQFSALDSLIASLNSTSSYLTQQLSALSNLTSGNNN